MGRPISRRHETQEGGGEERLTGPEHTGCWLCQRELGLRVEWHHPVPKAKKGRATVPLHPICHRAIHDAFSNAELARIGDDRGRLIENERLGKFLNWIADKPADFHAPTRRSR